MPEGTRGRSEGKKQEPRRSRSRERSDNRKRSYPQGSRDPARSPERRASAHSHDKQHTRDRERHDNRDRRDYPPEPHPRDHKREKPSSNGGRDNRDEAPTASGERHSSRSAQQGHTGSSRHGRQSAQPAQTAPPAKQSATAAAAALAAAASTAVLAVSNEQAITPGLQQRYHIISEQQMLELTTAQAGLQAAQKKVEEAKEAAAQAKEETQQLQQQLQAKQTELDKQVKQATYWKGQAGIGKVGYMEAYYAWQLALAECAEYKRKLSLCMVVCKDATSITEELCGTECALLAADSPQHAASRAQLQQAMLDQELGAVKSTRHTAHLANIKAGEVSKAAAARAEVRDTVAGLSLEDLRHQDNYPKQLRRLFTAGAPSQSTATRDTDKLDYEDPDSPSLRQSVPATGAAEVAGSSAGGA